jgi:hypothetical protein
MTGKFELPPPRWFNKSTGEYENIKPMYMIDEANPGLGLVPSDRVVQEDEAFRQFMEDKETKRRLRVERERQEERERVRQELNPPSPLESPTPKSKAKRDRPTNGGQGNEFDEEAAQKRFRKTTGRMISKRSATKITGPSTASAEDKARNMEKKYSPLKPLAPISDADIEKLPPAMNEEEIVQAWKNSPAVLSTPKQTPRSEAERARSLVQSRTGMKKGWMYSASRGSYQPPNTTITIDTSINRDGWTNTTPSTLEEEEPAQIQKLKGWRIGALESKAWWEGRNEALAQQWRERDKIREDKGRIGVNPVTGKLEDLAPAAKVDGRSYSVPTNLNGSAAAGIRVWRGLLTVDLLTGSPPMGAVDSSRSLDSGLKSPQSARISFRSYLHGTSNDN